MKRIWSWIFGVTVMSFFLGVFFALQGWTEDVGKKVEGKSANEKTLEFSGLDLEGEFKNPADFYFEHRRPSPQESLVKAREHFHPELLRDVLFLK